MTRIVLAVGDPETGNSMVYVVQEPLERVIDLCIPLQQPASALQARETMTFTKVGGGRVFIPGNGTIAAIEEYDGDD